MHSLSIRSIQTPAFWKYLHCSLSLTQNTSLWHAPVMLVLEHPNASSLPLLLASVADPLPHWGWDVWAQRQHPIPTDTFYVFFCLGCSCARVVSRTLDVYVSHSISSLGLSYIYWTRVLGFSTLWKRKEHGQEKKKKEKYKKSGIKRFWLVVSNDNNNHPQYIVIFFSFKEVWERCLFQTSTLLCLFQICRTKFPLTFSLFSPMRRTLQSKRAQLAMMGLQSELAASE